MTERELRVYRRFFEAGYFTPTEDEVSLLLSENDEDVSPASIERVLALLYEDFVTTFSPMWGDGDSFLDPEDW